MLAGGESRRMGEPKLLLEHAGQSLLSGAISKLRAVTDECISVVGAYAELYTPVAEQAGATVVRNPAWAEGLASSVRAGVAALPAEVTAALIVLPDQPFVEQAHLQALLDEHAASGAPLVFSGYRNILGAPALLHRSLFPKVQTLRGDAGLRSLIAEELDIAAVPLARPFDIDTPEDAERLKP